MYFASDRVILSAFDQCLLVTFNQVSTSQPNQVSVAKYIFSMNADLLTDLIKKLKIEGFGDSSLVRIWFVIYYVLLLEML